MVIEPFRMNGRKVRVATMALGRTWRNMMTTLETPERPGGADEVEVAGAQELGPDHADQAIQENSSIRTSSHQKSGRRCWTRMISR